MSAYVVIKLTDTTEGLVDIEQMFIMDKEQTESEKSVGEILYHRVYDFIEEFINEENTGVEIIPKKDTGYIQ